MDYKDYYKTLGVSKSATPDEIKKQYRRLARKYHPDVSKEPNAEEQFKAVKEAYEVLKNPEKRRAYDQLGAQPQGAGFTPPPGWTFREQGGGEPHFNQENFSDFFETLFGQGAHRQRRHTKMRGQDQRAQVTISLEEAYHGATRQLHLNKPELDSATGRVTTKAHTLNVKIPTGVTEGQSIRLAGQGEPGIGGGPNGDLYLDVKLAPHPFFSAQKKDIYLNLPIAPWEAALGAKVTTPTLGGNVELNIPAHAQSGQKLRLKGRGLPGKVAGDQYILLKIVIPEPKTDEQKQLYQTMSERMPFNPRAELLKE